MNHETAIMIPDWKITMRDWNNWSLNPFLVVSIDFTLLSSHSFNCLLNTISKSLLMSRSLPPPTKLGEGNIFVVSLWLFTSIGKRAVGIRLKCILVVTAVPVIFFRYDDVFVFNQTSRRHRH